MLLGGTYSGVQIFDHIIAWGEFVLIVSAILIFWKTTLGSEKQFIRQDLSQNRIRQRTLKFLMSTRFRLRIQSPVVLEEGDFDFLVDRFGYSLLCHIIFHKLANPCEVAAFWEALVPVVTVPTQDSAQVQFLGFRIVTDVFGVVGKLDALVLKLIVNSLAVVGFTANRGTASCRANEGPRGFEVRQTRVESFRVPDHSD